jgi:hypothetical protein
MNFRRLGRSRLVVSEIGLYVPPLEPADPAFHEAVAALKRARRNHASLFWLADGCGALFHEAFKGEREEAVVAFTVPAEPTSALKTCEQWLDVLQTDWLDVAFVDAAEDGSGDVEATFAALTKDPRIYAVGIASNNAGALSTWPGYPVALPWSVSIGLARDAIVVACFPEPGQPAEGSARDLLESINLALSSPGISCSVVSALTLDDADILTGAADPPHRRAAP